MKTKPWQRAATSDIPSPSELQAKREYWAAYHKAYDAARRAHRIANHLCTRCGEPLPAEHTTQACCYPARVGRKRPGKYS